MKMLQFFKHNKSKNLIYIYLLFLSSIIPILAIINPVLVGSDETLTFRTNSNILNHLYDLDFKNIFVELFKDFHPPGRNLFPLISIHFFGENISALRIPYYLLWIGSCFLTFKIVQNYSSSFLPSFLCITLTAGSGLFQLQIMGLGHGVVTFIGLLIIYRLLKIFKKKVNIIPFKEFYIISILSFICFLFFNTFILIIISLYIIQFFLILKNNIKFLKPFFISSFIFGSLHFIYLLLFLGLPYLIVHEPLFIEFLEKIFGSLNFGNWDYKPFGQYHQYLFRGDGIHLNYQSLINNISYLNWNFFPYISIIIIPISVIYLYIKHKQIFILLLPYLLVTSFFMAPPTAQHFASIFIWLLPFFSLFISEILSDYKLKIFVILLSILMIFFTLYCHIKIYDEKNYPYSLVKKFNGTLPFELWPQNLYIPVKEASDLIKIYNKKDVEIGYTGSNEMFMHYFEDNSIKFLGHDVMKILSEENLCIDKVKKLQLKVLISRNYHPLPCNKIIKKVLKFDNSSIVVFLLN